MVVCAWCWLLFGLLGLPIWLLVFVLPWVRVRWQVVRWGCAFC
jgi:hypothetical protein